MPRRLVLIGHLPHLLHALLRLLHQHPATSAGILPITPTLPVNDSSQALGLSQVLRRRFQGYLLVTLVLGHVRHSSQRERGFQVMLLRPFMITHTTGVYRPQRSRLRGMRQIYFSHAQADASWWVEH